MLFVSFLTEREDISEWMHKKVVQATACGKGNWGVGGWVGAGNCHCIYPFIVFECFTMSMNHLLKNWNLMSNIIKVSYIYLYYCERKGKKWEERSSYWMTDGEQLWVNTFNKVLDKGWVSKQTSGKCHGVLCRILSLCAKFLFSSLYRLTVPCFFYVHTVI